MADSYIIPSGSLSIGISQGSGRSLNLLRQYRVGTAPISQTAISTLASFFVTYVADDTVVGSAPYIMSKFRNGIVYKIYIYFTQCSSNGPYHDQNDGYLGLTVSGGSGGNFRLTGNTGAMNGTIEIGNGGTAVWPNLAGSYGGGGADRGYYPGLNIQDKNQGNNITVDVRCYETGYGSSSIYFGPRTYTTGQTFWNINP